MHKYTTNKPGS